jgi:hypothetical protein
MDRGDLGLLSRYPAAPRRLLTVDEYHLMGEVGILTDDDRVELIEGELVAMAPINSEHIAATNALTRLLVLAVGDRGIVSVGNPVRLTRHSEPQPDFSVLKPCDDYRKTMPRPEDTMLAVEVANTRPGLRSQSQTGAVCKQPHSRGLDRQPDGGGGRGSPFARRRPLYIRHAHRSFGHPYDQGAAGCSHSGREDICLMPVLADPAGERER